MPRPKWKTIFDFSSDTLRSLTFLVLFLLLMVTSLQVYYLQKPNVDITIKEIHLSDDYVENAETLESENSIADFTPQKSKSTHEYIDNTESTKSAEITLADHNKKDQSQSRTTQYRSEYKPPSSFSGTIDINSADSLDWKRLRGIGSYRAMRIIKFREALGGFHSLWQVGDTYGLPDSTFQMIKPNLKVETPWKKIDIDTASIKTLARHPYITTKEAYAIKKLTVNDYSPEEKQNYLREKLTRYEQVMPYLLID